MAETATRERTRPTRLRGHHDRWAELRAREREKIKERYAAHHGQDLWHPKQVRGMTAMDIFITTTGPDDPDGSTIKRPIKQIVAAIAKDVEWEPAKTQKEARDHRSSICRWLGYLKEIGYLVEDRTFDLAPSGEGEGIVIHLTSEARLGSSAVRALHS